MAALLLNVVVGFLHLKKIRKKRLVSPVSGDCVLIELLVAQTFVTLWRLYNPPGRSDYRLPPKDFT